MEPAISKWGILARSAIVILPSISLPSTTVSLLLALLNSGDSINSRILTMLTTLLATSTPTAAFPGIGASILTPTAARFIAISSARFVILLILTPAAGWSSYLVTAGPRQMFTILALTPKLARVSISIEPFWLSSVAISPSFVNGVGFRSVIGGLR